MVMGIKYSRIVVGLGTVRYSGGPWDETAVERETQVSSVVVPSRLEVVGSSGK